MKGSEARGGDSWGVIRPAPSFWLLPHGAGAYASSPGPSAWSWDWLWSMEWGRSNWMPDVRLASSSLTGFLLPTCVSAVTRGRMLPDPGG